MTPFLTIVAASVAAAVLAVLTLIALSRLALAVAARRTANTDPGRFIGARAADVRARIWCGPVTIFRWPYPREVEHTRVETRDGRMRAYWVAVAGVGFALDISERAARATLIGVAATIVGYTTYGTFAVSAAERPYLLAVLLTQAAFALTLLEADQLRTLVHYAEHEADLDQHEAWAVGRAAGIRYESESARFKRGDRYDAPPYPSNPYVPSVPTHDAA